jgi:hypothetical protein
MEQTSLNSDEEPLSLDYLSVNSVRQHNFKCSAMEQTRLKSNEQPLSMDYVQMSSMRSTFEQSSERSAEDIAEQEDRLSFYGASGHYIPTQEKGFYGPVNNFSSLPPVLNHASAMRVPPRCGRSVSCSNGLPVLHECSSFETADPPHVSIKVGATESILSKRSEDKSLKPQSEGRDENSDVKHESSDHLPSSTTSEGEGEKRSCAIL